MTDRRLSTYILPPDQWHRVQSELPASPLAALATFAQLNGILVVVEREGKLVAHWPLIMTWHAEPVYILPEERKNPVVIANLLEGLQAAMAAGGAQQALVIVEDPDVESIVVRLGFTHVPGSVYYASAPIPPS